ncbi:MAG: tRNA (adenosine(37)-N6)-threonylcarbamoyltransferase complex dimerization subunit type 1 TsaB, partial [Pseudomonadota bacterium]|nr:tRNA (adenosine(37)-N6)-threonylcarbamoyltransferase complex dimerization subunit type 1 TsaB [Pseudomonadota bacterium]
MRILARETATEACSVALFDGGVPLDARHEVLGRGHAERLVP